LFPGAVGLLLLIHAVVFIAWLVKTLFSLLWTVIFNRTINITLNTSVSRFCTIEKRAFTQIEIIVVAYNVSHKN
jgi:hypothetical protein